MNGNAGGPGDHRAAVRAGRRLETATETGAERRHAGDRVAAVELAEAGEGGGIGTALVKVQSERGADVVECRQ